VHHTNAGSYPQGSLFGASARTPPHLEDLYKGFNRQCERLSSCHLFLLLISCDVPCQLLRLLWDGTGVSEAARPPLTWGDLDSHFRHENSQVKVQIHALVACSSFENSCLEMFCSQIDAGCSGLAFVILMEFLTPQQRVHICNSDATAVTNMVS
jgi:hypothetical protein